MSRTLGYIRLVRPVNGLMMGFAVIVGASSVLANPLSIEIALNLFFGFLTAFLLSGASMAINDYCDREIDMVNEPQRPIPSGLVKPWESLTYAAILTLFGLLAALFTNLSCLAVAVVAWVVSVTYATKGKRTGLPGNFLVSACVAIPFIYGSFVVGQGLVLKVVFFAALAFLANTGREVAKGIVDIEGDRGKGMRTIAVSHGAKAAAYVAALFFLLATVLSFFPRLMGLVSVLYVPFVAIADIGFVSSSVMLVRDYSRERVRRIKSLVMVWMVFSMISFLAGNFESLWGQ